MNTMQLAFSKVGFKIHEVQCPYCFSPAKLVTGKKIHSNNPYFHRFNFWLCEPCDAYVRCHRKNKIMDFKGTEPLGRLANHELRLLRQYAHNQFDCIWKNNLMSRQTAYEWLSTQLKIPIDKCHIGMLDDDQCRLTIDISSKFISKHGIQFVPDDIYFQ